MLILLAQWLLILFGCFFIVAGMMMLFYPTAARQILRKAGSTNLINYTEITVRMIPAIALIVYADYSKQERVLRVVGWFMLFTSLILFLVPRKTHHAFSAKAAEILKPTYFRLVSPFSMIIGRCLCIASGEPTTVI